MSETLMTEANQTNEGDTQQPVDATTEQSTEATTETQQQADAVQDQQDSDEGPSTDPVSSSIAQNDLIEQAREEMRRKDEEEEKRMEIERRKKKAAELLRNVTKETVPEEGQVDDPGIDFSVIGFEATRMRT